jgi:hypothetical protein
LPPQDRYLALCEYLRQLLLDLFTYRAASRPPWLDTVGPNPTFVFHPLGDDYFLAINKRIAVNDVHIRRLADGVMPFELAQALVAIIYLHELRHHGQGLGPKPHVAWLVGAGAHEALLEMDLAADHAAAEDLAELDHRWNLVQLKELESLALFDYPATVLTHPSPAQRLRKSHRLVSVRTDYLLRAGRLSRRTWSGYISVRFGGHRPGNFVVMAQAADGPRLVGHVTLNPGELDTLRLASMSDRQLEELDHVLVRCLENLAVA